MDGWEPVSLSYRFLLALAGPFSDRGEKAPFPFFGVPGGFLPACYQNTLLCPLVNNKFSAQFRPVISVTLMDARGDLTKFVQSHATYTPALGSDPFRMYCAHSLYAGLLCFGFFR